MNFLMGCPDTHLIRNGSVHCVVAKVDDLSCSLLIRQLKHNTYRPSLAVTHEGG